MSFYDLNVNQLLRQIKHDLYITIPDDLWNSLYQNLQQEIVTYGSTRQNALLIEKTFDHIQIVNLKHQILVNIPQILDDLSEINFTKRFDMLSSTKKSRIKTLIQQTIDKSKSRHVIDTHLSSTTSN